MFASAVPYRPVRPKRRATWLEIRALLGHGRPVWQRGDAPTGGSGAVLVIPPLLCSDRTTAGLRAALSRAGFTAHGWELGRSWGPTPHLMQGVEARLIALTDRDGAIDLVGLSMGGLFARWLALRHPARVRQIVTVCSPYRAALDSFFLPLRFIARIWGLPELARIAAEVEGPLPVPVTAIYSRRDGIVAQESCYDPAEPESCVGIDGCHVTIPIDPDVTAIVVERLSRFRQEGLLF